MQLQPKFQHNLRKNKIETIIFFDYNMACFITWPHGLFKPHSSTEVDKKYVSMVSLIC